MRRSRQTREQLDAEIQVLLDKKKKLADEAVNVFVKALFTKDVKEAIIDLDDETLKARAKEIARILYTAPNAKIISSEDRRNDTTVSKQEKSEKIVSERRDVKPSEPVSVKTERVPAQNSGITASSGNVGAGTKSVSAPQRQAVQTANPVARPNGNVAPNTGVPKPPVTSRAEKMLEGLAGRPVTSGDQAARVY